MSTAKLWLDLISTSFPIRQLPSSRIEGDYNEPRRTATASNNGSGRGSYDKLGFGSSSNIVILQILPMMASWDFGKKIARKTRENKQQLGTEIKTVKQFRWIRNWSDIGGFRKPIWRSMILEFVLTSQDLCYDVNRMSKACNVHAMQITLSKTLRKYV